MKLRQHFLNNISSDIKLSRDLIIAAVLDDSEALAELEQYCELWLSLPTNTLSGCLGNINRLRKGDTAAHITGIVQHQARIGDAIESLYMRAIDDWLDGEFQTVNMTEIKQAERE